MCSLSLNPNCPHISRATLGFFSDSAHDPPDQFGQLALESTTTPRVADISQDASWLSTDMPEPRITETGNWPFHASISLVVFYFSSLFAGAVCDAFRTLRTQIKIFKRP